MRPDCNRCDMGAKCKGAVNLKTMIFCPNHLPPHGGFKLAEMTLAHPSSLNKALSALFFEVKIKDYIKGI